MTLLPETYGQSAQMTITEGSGTNAEEIGHWYSPAAVARLISGVREAYVSACEHEMGVWANEGQEDLHDFRLCIAAIRALSPPETETTCTWTQEDFDCAIWNTECGEVFGLNEGSPSENNMWFCFHCGKTLVEHLK